VRVVDSLCRGAVADLAGGTSEASTPSKPPAFATFVIIAGVEASGRDQNADEHVRSLSRKAGEVR
jgi:hypothetical protein